jgi:hypothetical protein
MGSVDGNVFRSPDRRNRVHTAGCEPEIFWHVIGASTCGNIYVRGEKPPLGGETPLNEFWLTEEGETPSLSATPADSSFLRSKVLLTNANPDTFQGRSSQDLFPVIFTGLFFI